MLSKEVLKNALKKFTEIDGVSGSEQSVIKAVVEEISPFCDEVKITAAGNVIALKKGAKPGPSVAIVAHMDQIGFIVKSILPGGFLRLTKVGGAPNNTLPARKVWVGNNKIPGIIGMKPGHLQTPEEATKAPDIEKCYVDIGVNSKEEAEKLGIKIGTQVTFQSDFMEMNNPDLICTRSIDDRICCCLIIELMKNIAKEEFAGNFYGVFTVKEEVGLRGAQTALFGLDIDYAIAIDTFPATDTPDTGDASGIDVRLGHGPAVPVSEGGPVRFNMIHPAVLEIVSLAAENTGKNLQLCSMLGISYGTDAAALAYSGGGTPAGAVAVPRRYSHSPGELVNINDAIDLYEIIVDILKNNENADLAYI